MLSITIGFRVDPEFQEILKKVCQARREDMSDFIRRAILKELAELSFLPSEQKKALGVVAK